jgi:hypothetical protein
MASKKRKKWIISILLGTLTIIAWIVATIFNYKDIPIQENFIKYTQLLLNFLKWLLGFIFAGYSMKLWKGGQYGKK